jgi:SAM-dependent methyltransferase
MPHPDALHWNARYASEDYQFRREPRPLLTSRLNLLPETGLALDVACGTSPTGIFLAARGWRVIGLDVAETALRRTQARARKEAVSVSLAVVDLTKVSLPAARFDLIMNFYYLERSLWPSYQKALKPGGLLFFETLLWHPEIERHHEHYLRQPDELRQAFAGWDVLHYDEINRPRCNDHRMKCVAQLVARKPIQDKETK